MKATEILMSEHRVIEKMLDTLDAAVVKLQQNKPVKPSFFLEAVDFIRNFADGFHHHKEEGVLFLSMIKNGMDKDSGPIGVMFQEHDLGRSYTLQIYEGALKLEKGNQSSLDTIVENATNYVTLLRQHIYKEDNILFPMADRVIPAAQHEQVLKDFERVEAEETGEDVHKKYLALAEKLSLEVQE